MKTLLRCLLIGVLVAGPAAACGKDSGGGGKPGPGASESTGSGGSGGGGY